MTSEDIPHFSSIRPRFESFVTETLIAVPHLEATLAWHRAARQHVWEDELDDDHSYENPKMFSYLVWGDDYRYLSMGLLLATRIGDEIMKALQSLGYQSPARKPSLREDDDIPDDYPSNDRLVVDSEETLKLDAAFLGKFSDAHDQRLIATAIDLANVLNSVRGTWLYEDPYGYEAGEGGDLPIVPRIDTLPNWNVSGELWEDDWNHYIHPPTLVACCEGILMDLVDLILNGKRG